MKMAKNIEPKLVTIGSYLTLEEDAKFIIPEYQRKYAWEVQNCDKLWSDIKDFIESCTNNLSIIYTFSFINDILF